MDLDEIRDRDDGVINPDVAPGEILDDEIVASSEADPIADVVDEEGGEDTDDEDEEDDEEEGQGDII